MLLRKSTLDAPLPPQPPLRWPCPLQDPSKRSVEASESAPRAPQGDQNCLWDGLYKSIQTVLERIPETDLICTMSHAISIQHFGISSEYIRNIYFHNSQLTVKSLHLAIPGSQFIVCCPQFNVHRWILRTKDSHPPQKTFHIVRDP